MCNSRVTCSSTPPSLTPGGLLGAGQLELHGRLDLDVEPHAQQVDVHRLAADRVALEFLEHDRRRRGALDLEVEHCAGVRERVAQFARRNLEGDRVLAAAVEDAGHVAARGAGGARCANPRARARLP